MNSDFISDKAKIHSSVKIGPYCVIGENVEIGENCVLQSHVVITGNTKIGNNNVFYPFTSQLKQAAGHEFSGKSLCHRFGQVSLRSQVVRVIYRPTDSRGPSHQCAHWQGLW